MAEEYRERLAGRLEEEYGFAVTGIAPAKRGFFGETWRVETGRGAYFLKIDYWGYHQEAFRRSLPVVNYLAGQGLDFVPPALATCSGALSWEMDGGVAAAFPFVEGENREDYPVQRLFCRLGQVYRLPGAGLGLEEEGFGPEALEEMEGLLARPDLPRRALRAVEACRPLLARHARGLEEASRRCQGSREGFAITHGDAGGNCILRGRQFAIVDWDSVKLAPPERDAWFFLCGPGQLACIARELGRQGFPYAWRQERLCYYGYHSFFHYITEYLRAILQARGERRQALEKALEGYFSGSWIHRQLEVIREMEQGL